MTGAKLGALWRRGELREPVFTSPGPCAQAQTKLAGVRVDELRAAIDTKLRREPDPLKASGEAAVSGRRRRDRAGSCRLYARYREGARVGFKRVAGGWVVLSAGA